MNRRYLWRFVTVAALATIGLGAVGWVVMSLWNWLAPATFGGHVIGFWQALGLFVLARILVGGLRRGGHGRGPWRRRVSERWEAMSDEERARFQHRFGGRCGGPRVDKAGGLPA